MKIKVHKTVIKLLTFYLFVLCAAAAQAAEIQNLSNKPQKIEARGEGGEYQEIIVEAGRTYSLTGLMRVRFAGIEVTIQPNEQFAIWDDKTISPQRAWGRGNN